MLSSTQFLPGTILWLPSPADIPDYDPQHVHKSVPKKCFNHPVLVLLEDKANKFVTILIITSFHNSNNISTRVQRRGHELKYYAPIHPADALDPDTPTLRLAAAQETARPLWANVQPYRCPSAWLQATWSSVWKGKRRGGKVETASLRALALYGIQEGYEPGVYKKVLEGLVERVEVPEVVTPASRMGLVRVGIPENSRVAAGSGPGPCAGVVDRPAPRFEAGPVRSFSWGGSGLGEREPLLPKTHRPAQRKSWVYRPGGGNGGRPGRKGSLFVVWVLCVVVGLVFLVAVGGVFWVGYVVVGRVIAACRGAVVAFAGPLKGRVLGWAGEAGRALRDAGTEVRALWEWLGNWVRQA